MEIDASITLLFDESGMMIEVRDNSSRVRFLTIKLNQEQTCQALSRLASVECERAEVFGLENIGKEKVIKKLEFPLPKDYSRFDDRDQVMLIGIARGSCDDGWTVDEYFSSQNSFFRKDGQDWARTSQYRYDDREEDENSRAED